MSEDAASLYRQWWSMLPSFFAAMQPAAAMAATAAPAAATPPPPADGAAAPDWLAFMRQAPQLSGDAFTRLFDAWAPLLGQSGAPLADGLRRLADSTDENLKWLQDAWSAANPLGAGGSLQGLPALPGWATPLLFAAGGAVPSDRMNPLQIGADRTFGALADAIGARPLREVQEAWQVLLRSEIERRAAQAAYFGLVGKAWSAGTRQLLDRLEQMRRNGEQVSSMVGLLKLWAGEADAALHERMQSPEGLAATAQLVRASTDQRAELQRVVGLLSQALNMPTRAEVDDSYREIQELKRELRRLKKALPAERGSRTARAGARQPSAAKDKPSAPETEPAVPPSQGARA